MKTIPLSQGMVAIVDDEDFEWLNQWKWHLSGSKYRYAARNTVPQPGLILMHRVISKASPGLLVDHIDRNPLNNQKANLRLCSKGQNRSNSVASARSGYKGVTFIQRDNLWFSQISHNGGHIALGWFKNPIEAALAYDAAALEFHGEFALTNKQLHLI